MIESFLKRGSGETLLANPKQSRIEEIIPYPFHINHYLTGE
jgi:hypothetical protein